jgi:hypothetical protein
MGRRGSAAFFVERRWLKETRHYRATARHQSLLIVTALNAVFSPCNGIGSPVLGVLTTVGYVIKLISFVVKLISFVIELISSVAWPNPPDSISN